MKIYTTCLTVWVAICFSIVASSSAYGLNDGSRYTTNSKLSSGKWIKLKVTQNAIYKLTYEDIKKMGIEDPAKVKVFGYGGWKLDEDFTKPYVDDLPEVSVWLSKGPDGVFGSGDYLLFYGRGTVKWKGSEHENNPYSTYGAYFLTDEGEGGPKEMALQASEKDTQTTFTTFDDYFLHEKDSITITNSGRELFGESFVGRDTRDFDFTIPGLVPNTGTAYLSFAARPGEKTPVSLSINGVKILEKQVDKVTDGYRKANLVNGSGSWSGGEGSNPVRATVNYNAAGQTVAYLNYVKIGASRYLQPYENESYTFFRKSTLASPGIKNAQYKVANATDKCLVFDVTGNFDTRLVETTLNGSDLTFGAALPNQASAVKEYVLADVSKNFNAPESLGEVKNQDLHALPQAEMIILAPEIFLDQAKALAEEHRTRSGLSVNVVQADSVFNEFSSGVPDATAYRRFMKMFYDRAATAGGQKPKYLLLFGDGIFDNRFITAQTSKLDKKYYLTTYQVVESVFEGSSFGTDDYFGFLDDNEGVYIGSDGLDIGIGRFPVSSLSQANDVVTKIVTYMNNKRLGDWKNKVIFTADDTDYTVPGDSFCSHANQSDSLARYMERTHPGYMVTRSYMDAFKPLVSNGKKTYPDAKKRLMETLKEGCFLLNYTGHGSTTAWSSEDMLNVSDVRQMAFQDLPLWITATCDFGWFDGVTTSAGEEAFLNPKSGGIALFTTSRVVDSDPNYYLNDKLVRNIFLKENGKHLRLGDILRISKNQRGADSNKLNYILLGDPALELNYPECDIQLESINGKSISQNEVLQFRALDEITLTGTVRDESNAVMTDFNGNLRVTVFDSKQIIESIVTNNVGGHFTFTDYPNIVYPGSAAVKEGSFTVTFKVPRDISYSNENGKMSFYASDPTSGIEAQGHFQDYFLNGTNENSETNTEGPEILSLYLNSPSFKEGDSVNETPYFVARVSDPDGINMTGSGLGHNITITIDDAVTYNLDRYYEPISNVEGEVRYSIPALSPGKHTLVFRVWDILNNSSVDSLGFSVVPGLKQTLYDIRAAANPAKIETFFLLEHDRPDTKIDVEIRVYDLSGRIVWTHRESGSSDWMTYYPIRWNLTTDGGRRVTPGIYVYRATIQTANSKEATKAKKIIVLGQ